jgi:hypothetical protein
MPITELQALKPFGVCQSELFRIYQKTKTGTGHGIAEYGEKDYINKIPQSIQNGDRDIPSVTTFGVTPTPK